VPSQVIVNWASRADKLHTFRRREPTAKLPRRAHAAASLPVGGSDSSSGSGNEITGDGGGGTSSGATVRQFAVGTADMESLPDSQGGYGNLDSDQAVGGNGTVAAGQFSQTYRGSNGGSNSGSSGGGSGGNGGGNGNHVGGEGGKVGSGGGDGDGGAHGGGRGAAAETGSNAGRPMSPSGQSNADSQPSAGGLEADWWTFNGVYTPGLR
jgi:hypothetical protein